MLANTTTLTAADNGQIVKSLRGNNIRSTPSLLHKPNESPQINLNLAAFELARIPSNEPDSLRQSKNLKSNTAAHTAAVNLVGKNYIPEEPAIEGSFAYHMSLSKSHSSGNINQFLSRAN